MTTNLTSEESQQVIRHEDVVDLKKWRWWHTRDRLILPERDIIRLMLVLGGILLVGSSIVLARDNRGAFHFSWLIILFWFWITWLCTVLLARPYKQLLRQCGRHVTFRMEYTAEGFSYAAGYAIRYWIDWRFCRASFERRSITFRYEGITVRVNRSYFTPLEFEQVRFWANRGAGKSDVCMNCKYDLHGTEGPTCPECGNPVRRLIRASWDKPANEA